MRQVCRDGLLVLVGDEVNVIELETLLGDAVPTGLPVRVVGVGALGDEGVVAQSLQVASDEIWLVRPDAHTAACVREPEAIVDAVRRVLGG